MEFNLFRVHPPVIWCYSIVRVDRQIPCVSLSGASSLDQSYPVSISAGVPVTRTGSFFHKPAYNLCPNACCALCLPCHRYRLPDIITQITHRPCRRSKGRLAHPVIYRPQQAGNPSSVSDLLKSKTVLFWIFSRLRLSHLPNPTATGLLYWVIVLGYPCSFHY